MFGETSLQPGNRWSSRRMFEGDTAMTRLRINGEPMSVDADRRMPLLWVIRDVLGMTGTKFGCGVGACGACTVHLDGDAVRSCVTALADADGKDVTTVVVEVAVDDDLLHA